MRTQKIKPNASIQRALSPPLYGGSCASPTPSLSAVHVHDFLVVLCRLLRLAFVAGIKCESTRKRISLPERERERERDFCFSIAICHICGNCFVLLLPACSFPSSVSSFPLQLLQLSRRTPNFRLNFDSLRIAGKQQADFSFGYCAAGYLISWCL